MQCVQANLDQRWYKLGHAAATVHHHSQFVRVPQIREPRNVRKHKPSKQMLAEQGALVSYHDPYVERVEVSGREYKSVPLDAAAVKEADCIVLLTAHSSLDLELLESAEAPVVDTRNVLRRENS